MHHAGNLFNLQGYKATSISHITEATGLTKGAIYRHFKNKEKLEEQSLVYLTGVMFEKLRTEIKQENNMSERMQMLQKVQGIKMSRYQANASNRKLMSLTQDFEHNVMQDQATSVFLTANARLLQKAQALN